MKEIVCFLVACFLWKKNWSIQILKLCQTVLVHQGIKTYLVFFNVSIISRCINWKITFLAYFLNKGSSLISAIWLCLRSQSQLQKKPHILEWPLVLRVPNCIFLIFVCWIIPSNVKSFWTYFNEIAQYIDKFNSPVSNNYMISHIHACFGN